MTMQYDVNSVHLNSSGFAVLNRIRVKGMVVSTSATGGQINVWDSATAPIAATYAQSGYTVTVTSTAHGLTTGNRIGISYNVASGVSATNGNYVITVTGNDTFTVTDINSRTIIAGTVCSYVSNTGKGTTTQWHSTVDMGGAAGTTNIIIPGEGLLIEVGLYLSFGAGVTGVTMFYG